jgi:hypothetical protein
MRTSVITISVAQSSLLEGDGFELPVPRERRCRDLTFPGADLPRTRLWIAGRRFRLSGVFEPAREFVGDALPVALASSFAAERSVEGRLEADREHDARHLHAHRETKRVKLVNRT